MGLRACWSLKQQVFSTTFEFPLKLFKVTAPHSSVTLSMKAPHIFSLFHSPVNYSSSSFIDFFFLFSQVISSIRRGRMQTTRISIGRPSNPVPPSALSEEKRHFHDKKSPLFLISKMDTISIDESVLGLLIYENHFCASRRGTRHERGESNF